MNFISPNLIQYPTLLDNESIMLQKSSTTYTQAQTMKHSEHKIVSNSDFKNMLPGYGLSTQFLTKTIKRLMGNPKQDQRNSSTHPTPKLTGIKST